MVESYHIIHPRVGEDTDNVQVSLRRMSVMRYLPSMVFLSSDVSRTGIYSEACSGDNVFTLPALFKLPVELPSAMLVHSLPLTQCHHRTALYNGLPPEQRYKM